MTRKWSEIRAAKGAPPMTPERSEMLAAQFGDRETDRSEAVAALRDALRDAMQMFQDRTYLDEANHRYHCGGSEADRLLEYLGPELERRGLTVAALRPERKGAGLRTIDFAKWRDRTIEAVETLAEDNGYALSDRDHEMVAAAVASLLGDDEFLAALRGTGAEPERPSLDVRIDAYLDDRLVPCPDPTAHEEADHA